MAVMPANVGADADVPPDSNKSFYFASASSINVCFADKIEARVKAIPGKQRDIGNIAFAVIGHT
jgi:hypothetical protein